MKKVKINENCIGCGACTAIAPGFFELNEEGYAKAKQEEIKEITNDIEEAIEGCPTNAIEINEEKNN